MRRYYGILIRFAAVARLFGTVLVEQEDWAACRRKYLAEVWTLDMMLGAWRGARTKLANGGQVLLWSLRQEFVRPELARGLYSDSGSN